MIDIVEKHGRRVAEIAIRKIVTGEEGNKDSHIRTEQHSRLVLVNSRPWR